MPGAGATVSSNEPFTEGRPNTEKGNDKVVIVLTDGANTYSIGPSNDTNNSYANKVDLCRLWLYRSNIRVGTA